MKLFYSCERGMEYCMRTERFAISYLISGQKTRALHVHDCYEFYYSIASGNEFFLRDKYYKIHPHDVFFVGPNEKHRIIQHDGAKYERLDIAVHPSFLERYSTEKTSLVNCFLMQGHQEDEILNLSWEYQKQFEYLLHKITMADGFGADLMEDLYFCKILIMLNDCWASSVKTQQTDNGSDNATVKAVLQYINGHLTEEMNIGMLAKEFFVSPSYLCRSFKKYTGITINKYVSARRIRLAVILMEDGCHPSDVFFQAGFNNYNTFYKTFVDIIGISPKEYRKYS